MNGIQLGITPEQTGKKMRQKATFQVAAIRRIVQALRQMPLFAQCSDSELMMISSFCEEARVSADRKVFREGDVATAFYFVVDGLVELVKKSPSGKEKVVEFMETGDAFAEGVVFSNDPYPVTAIAIMDTELLCIDATRFRRYVQDHHEVSWRMLSALSKRLHSMVTQISSLSLLNAEQRVAEYLIENLDRSNPLKPVYQAPTPRKKLASRLNLTPETLCRVLATFRRRGWVDSPGGTKLRVLNVEALENLLGTVRRDNPPLVAQHS